jgi:REP element-mobilizing transposase RayT
MSEFIHKPHNVSVLLYHIVCPAEYRRVVINEEADKTIKGTRGGISKRHEVKFLETGAGGDRVYFLVQSVSAYGPTKVVTIIKSIIAREVFAKHPEVKKVLWGGGFRSDGNFASTVRKYGNEETITNYVKAQGAEEEYKERRKKQLELFD